MLLPPRLLLPACSAAVAIISVKQAMHCVTARVPTHATAWLSAEYPAAYQDPDESIAGADRQGPPPPFNAS